MFSLKNLKFKLKTCLQKKINFYPKITHNHELQKKIIIQDGSFVKTSKEEISFYIRVRETFDNLDFSHGFIQRRSFVVNIKNSVFLGNSGALEKNNKLIAESYFNVGRLAGSSSYRNPLFLRMTKKAGIFTSILHLPYAKKNIYHWTIDCLPRLYNISKIPCSGKIYIILNVNLEQYQEETLSFFLKKDLRLELIRIKENEKWELENFWLPSFVTSSQSGYMPEEYITYIKNTIIEGYQIKAADKKKKIYISRRLSNRRQLINEKEIEVLLAKKGFEIIYAENLVFRNQVKIFSEADCVISPHGAGLTNIIYSTKLKIIEIHPENYVQPHYSLLSKACGHSYYPFIAGKLNKNKGYRIDIESFNFFLSTL